jgi:DNA-binding CsgD family transcriptional regulator
VRGAIERAWALAQEVQSAPSPDAFADVVVEQLVDLIPCDEVTFNDIDESEQRFVVLRTWTTPLVTDLRFSVELVLASPRPYRWAVLLGRADRDFTDRECDVLSLLSPHLERAYRKARLRSLVSAREREVLTLVGDGLTNREIARRLDISPGTVRAHLEHAYPKLGVGSRAAAASIIR